MRSRKEIEHASVNSTRIRPDDKSFYDVEPHVGLLILEVLLDIRALLTNPPIEISGAPIKPLTD